ncbi:MAG: sodium/solute symporter [bacterium]|nr:sodium/solute symporter [bacterium]
MILFGDIHIHVFDLVLIVVYLVGMIAFGFYYSRHVKGAHDYFLAGRSLPWWVVGMSIVGSNLGSNDYVGAAGGGYRIGIAQANFEWIGAIPAMILCAFIFIPYFWRAGVYSIPEYLGLRYNQAVRVIAALILSFFSLFIVGIYLWATATMLQVYVGIDISVGVWITAVVVGLYTITGGMAAVAISDTVQFGIMIAGGLALAVLGVHRIGGVDEFVTRLSTEFPNHLNAFLPADHAEFPWPGVLLGLALVMSPSYWCANQVILQRTFAAKSRWDGQAAMIFAAFAKTVMPFLIILPGFLVLLMSTDSLENQDQALPWLIREVLPPGLSGLLFVAFIAALQSSVDSTLNSTAVMLTRDVYGVVKKSDANMNDAAERESRDRSDLRLGKWITFSVLALGVLFALNIDSVKSQFRGIYSFVQLGLSYFQGPMFALLLLGILTRSVTASAGVWGLGLGVLSAVYMGSFGLPGMAGGELNMLYIAFYSFLFTVGLLFAISPFTAAKSDEQLRNLTIQTTDKQRADDSAEREG